MIREFLKIKSRLLSQKGFTLIELLVVIAILGILAVVLITIINPVDKINLVNDDGVISTVAQLGRANENYATSHGGVYVGPAGTTAFSGAVAGPVVDLYTAGEIKFSKVTVPSASYVYDYLAGPAGCTTAANNCTSYVFYVGTLDAQKYAATLYYWYTNGKGCFKAAAPVASTDTCP